MLKYETATAVAARINVNPPDAELGRDHRQPALPVAVGGVERVHLNQAEKSPRDSTTQRNQRLAYSQTAPDRRDSSKRASDRGKQYDPVQTRAFEPVRTGRSRENTQ